MNINIHWSFQLNVQALVWKYYISFFIFLCIQQISPLLNSLRTYKLQFINLIWSVYIDYKVHLFLYIQPIQLILLD